MAACLTHAQSAARQWGGEPDEYIVIHQWFDEPKDHIGDFRQRALRHHTFGIRECLDLFGEAFTISTGRTIPTRWICERHMIEDFGRIPSLQDWLQTIQPQPWMSRGARNLSAELFDAETRIKEHTA